MTCDKKNAVEYITTAGLSVENDAHGPLIVGVVMPKIGILDIPFLMLEWLITENRK